MSTLQAVHGTSPDPPCGEFDIEAVAEDGTRRKVPLASATRTPFADMTPVRRIKARKGQRHLPGRWWSATDGRHIGYESWLERDQLMSLDWDRAVTGTASQPFRLRWTTEEGEPSCSSLRRSTCGAAGGAAGKGTGCIERETGE